MPYGFAQRVVKATPDTVFRAARRAAREAGAVTGPTMDPNGAFGERYVPIVDGPTAGRLWAWPLTAGLSVVYLGLADGSPLARLAPLTARRRLRTEAERLLDRVGERPEPERADLPLAA